MSVYIVQRENGDVKIGYTSRAMAHRLIGLRCENSCELKVLKVIPGERYLESAYHRYFSAYSIGHEWFRFTPEMLDITINLPELKSVSQSRPVDNGPSLRGYCLVAGYGIKNIADAFGVSYKTASRWLTRRTPVPHQHMAKFAAMIGVTVEDLLPRSQIESGCSDKQESAM